VKWRVRRSHGVANRLEMSEPSEASLDPVAMLVDAGVVRDEELAAAVLGEGTAMAFIAAILIRRSLPSQALSACMAGTRKPSRRSGATVMSLLWPGVTRKRKRRPSASGSLLMQDRLVGVHRGKGAMVLHRVAVMSVVASIDRTSPHPAVSGCPVTSLPPLQGSPSPAG